MKLATTDCRHVMTVGMLLLAAVCIPTPTHALPVAEAQSFRAAANERKPVTGMISSLFGGIMDAFQGSSSNGAKTNEVEVGGRNIRDTNVKDKLNRALSGGSSQEGIFINAGGSNYTDTEGTTWIADTGLFTEGKSYSTSADITNTDKPKLYQSVSDSK